MKIKLNNIKNEITGQIYVIDITDCLTNAGKNYCRCVITDGDTTLTASIFNTSKKSLENNNIVAPGVYDAILEKNGNYMNLKWLSLNSEPNITSNDFISKSAVNPEAAYNMILEYIEKSKIEDSSGIYNSITLLTKKIYEKYKNILTFVAAGKSIHHNYIGGLMEHTLSIVKSSWSMLEQYPELNKELLICGAALHDIGKVEEMVTDSMGQTTYTTIGNLLGHHCEGILIIDREVQEDKSYNPETVMLLEHIIASHHGKREYGAITPPMIPEAVMLHFLDDIDANMNKYKKAYKDFNVLRGTISDQKILGIDGPTPIYLKA